MDFVSDLQWLPDYILEKTLVWFGSVIVVASFIRKVTQGVDSELNQDAKNQISNKILDIGKWDFENWMPNFQYIFDSFFGKDHFTLHCFLKSFKITLAVFFVFAFPFALLTGVFGEIKDFETLFGYTMIGLMLFVPSALLMNVFVDYVSLLETRLILDLRFPLVLKLVIDTAITLTLLILWISFSEFLCSSTKTYSQSLDSVWRVFVGQKTNSMFGIVEFGESAMVVILIRCSVLTGFVTSIWLWLHALSEITLRMFKTTSFVVNWLNVKERPMSALGIITNMWLLFFSVLLFPFYVIFF